MKRKYTILAIILFVIIMGTIVGIITSKIDESFNSEDRVESKFVNRENELSNEIDLLTTSYNEEKTTPNTIFVFKTNYKKCGHIEEKKKEITEDLVNKTKEEITIEFSEWNIESFSKDKVLFYRELDKFCNEHYIVRDNDGQVTIYFLNEDGEEVLNGITEIVTLYLPEDDQKKLKNGIEIVGRENLNSFLEDYE